MKRISTLLIILLFINSASTGQISTNDPQMLPSSAPIENRNVILQWTVMENEKSNYFELQKSSDGINFISVGLIFTSETAGKETYMFKDIKTLKFGLYYRLKIINNDKNILYSKIILLNSSNENINIQLPENL
ncbi:MAG: hypothetical protein ICV66_04210 [Chitinophagaceae bacterium]|nr:hypothetical protein [Chitinophagaceae bacterium]